MTRVSGRTIEFVGTLGHLGSKLVSVDSEAAAEAVGERGERGGESRPGIARADWLFGSAGDWKELYV